jgi:lysophospholipase L1-like esterase
MPVFWIWINKEGFTSAVELISGAMILINVRDLKLLTKLKMFSRTVKIGLLIPLLFLISCSRKYTVLNKGVAGNNSFDLLKRINQDVIAEKPTLVILMVGTNDMINSRKFVSYSDFQTNYQAILGKLREHDVTVVVMIPPPVDTGYIFTRHSRSLFDSDPNARIDSIAKIIKNLAADNSVGVIDLNKTFKDRGEPHREASSLIVNEMNLGKTDGIHPTSQGYKLISGEVYAYLKKKKLFKRKNIIICFGDSMTYGSFMQGAGTAEGETYPAYLNDLLEGGGE